MSRVAKRIITALSIPAKDVFEIGPNVVAVAPIWQTAIQQWVNDNGQEWYSNWFKKRYLASKIQVGTPETQYVWCIHRGPVTAKPRTLAEQCVRFRPTVLGSHPTNDSAFWTKAQGIVMANTVGRYNESTYWGDAIIPEDTSITGIQKHFAGAPFGADVNIVVPMRPANTVAVGGKEEGVYVMNGDLTPAELPPPILNMLLIEGPSTFDYGEVSPWYEFFLVTNNTVRQDMIEANRREPSLGLHRDLTALENDPTGGLGYLKMSVKTSINPFDMIPNFRPYADEIFESDQVVESVAMSDIRNRWNSETVFIGGFAGDETLRTSFPEGVTEDNEAEAIASLDAATVAMVIQSSDMVSVSATDVNGKVATASLTGSLAVVVAKRLSVRGVKCTVTVSARTAPAGDGPAIMALLAELGSAINSQSVVSHVQTNLRKMGQTDQVGYSALVATTKLMSYDQRIIASSLLIPGMVYDNTTARSIVK